MFPANVLKVTGYLTAIYGYNPQNWSKIANLHTLAGLRHQVQLAADQAFPWRTPGVAAIRQSFLLPPDRPLPH